MRFHVDEHRRRGTADRLNQANIGAIARIGEHGGLRTHQARHALFESLESAGLVMHERSRYRIAMTGSSQDANLCLDHARIAGNAQVVVAA